MKFLTTIMVISLTLSSVFAHEHEEHKKKTGHDVEHSHVEGDKVNHEHDELHHKPHDHKAHHPDHEDKKKSKK